MSFLVFLETEHAYTQQAKQNVNVGPGREGKGRTDAHLSPRRGALPVDRILEHLRLDRIRRLLVLLPFAFPTVKARRRRPRQPVVLKRTLSPRGITSRRSRRARVKECRHSGGWCRCGRARVR